MFVSVTAGDGYFCEDVGTEDDSFIVSEDRACLLGLENAEAIFLAT